MSAPALDADGVSKRYGGVVALDGVSLSVPTGEVFGLIGPNGAGKTTLVRALTGTTDVAGRVRVFGRPPTEVDADRVGLLPQSFAPAARLTARELVGHYAGLYDEARAVADVLADVGLGGDADTRYENLSGGQRRRACVATALVNDPDLLVLDEPTTGIDPAGSRDIRRLLADLADGGTTVFLTSHAMDEVERLADRVGLLADGDLVAVGSPAELVDEHGGGNRLKVTTDAGGVPETLDGYAVEPTDDGLVVRGVEPTAVGRVVEALEAADVDYDALTWRRPGLENVYLRLTGERVGSGGETRSVASDGPRDPRRTTGAERGEGA
ncbi:MAG: ABC transporter ATP-binding protein [Haloferacaceae archaeon]